MTRANLSRYMLKEDIDDEEENFIKIFFPGVHSYIYEMLNRERSHRIRKREPSSLEAPLCFLYFLVLSAVAQENQQKLVTRDSGSKFSLGFLTTDSGLFHLYFSCLLHAFNFWNFLSESL